MKKNLGFTDAIMRVAAALAIVVLYFTGAVSGIAAIILIAFAIVFVITAFVGFCPLYFPFRISTRKK
ncbi:YgaP family membrane protein [Polluticoccus soli]|uniref:YgaP family membrane protein n=1 Tax=Polluticoccus soli TaxID=3034150 RepID=UPI0023E0E0FC|nr:DUF2892 domain-containing protein [Flavipsychrobacter sp. JY13-12]